MFIILKDYRVNDFEVGIVLPAKPKLAYNVLVRPQVPLKPLSVR
jgi:hypothetical protein